MKGKTMWYGLRIAVVLALMAATGVLAEPRTPVHFGGTISDYSPATVAGKLVGPWEMRGTWSLDVKGRSGLADFSAAWTMEHSDYAITDVGVNVDDPGTRTPHTHHITMTNATVSYDTSTCPKNSPATTNPGFMVTGQPDQLTITANGGSAPFETNPPSSTLQVCINGGTDVTFSNITLVFTGPATTHFGPQAIHGVVRRPRLSDFDDAH